MKINSISEHSVQNNNSNFKAKLQLKGNIKLLAKEEVNKLKEIASKIGSETDIIDIALPASNRFIKNKGSANIAGYVNGVLEQFTQSVEKSDVLKGVVAGLEMAKEIFPKTNESTKVILNTEETKTIKPANEKVVNTSINMNDPKTKELLKELRSNVCSWLNLEESKVPNYCKDFLELGEKINDPLPWHKRPVITLVAQNRKKELLELLLKHPNINVNVQDAHGVTPLHILCSNYGNNECLKLLLERDDLDPKIKNHRGLTPEQCLFGVEVWNLYDAYKKNNPQKF